MGSQTPNQPSPLNGTLYLYWIAAIVTAIFLAFSSMMMALGTGLASSEDEPVSRVSQALWGISGISFLPIAVLLIVATATRKRIFGVILGLLIIVAGILAAVGWFVNADGDMPGTTWGNVIVIAVVVVPLIVGSILIWRADSLKPR